MPDASRTLPRRPALIFGGVSPEHEVSIMSAGQVFAALLELGETDPLAVQPVYINREGDWCFWRVEPHCTEATPDAIARAAEWDLRPDEFPVDTLTFPRAIARLVELEIDAAFILIHGPGGEDGKLQAAFDMLGLRYTGSGAAASALSLHKPHSQAVLRAAGVPIPSSTSLHWGAEEFIERVVSQIIESVGLPCVVKPAWGGSSFGVSVARSAEELAEALETAAQVDDEILIEQFIAGREVTCGVIERGGTVFALPPTEIIPPEGRMFDYEAKYEAGVSREVTPADLPAAVIREIQALAHRSHTVLGCRGFSRVDMMLDAQLRPLVIDVNTIPGMTGTSLLPQAAAVAGMPMTELLRVMLGAARHD